MGATNKFGLKRSDITSQQKRTIRQNSGFGCVICGNAIVEYEHVDPEFAEARKHDPSAMTLLCIQCHGKVTKGHLSKTSVKKVMESPAALKAGFSFEAFNVGDTPPTIRFGGMSAQNCKWAIRVNDRPVFWIKAAEEPGGPFRLNAEIRNGYGEIIFQILDNEWRVRPSQWDVEVIGQFITLRSGPGEIVLRLRTDPPNTIIIDKMDMSIEGYRLVCDGSKFTIIMPSGKTATAEDTEFYDYETAVELKGGGAAFGCGGGSGHIGSLRSGMASTLPKSIDFSRRRNSNCPCGSGKRYKNCCGAF